MDTREASARIGERILVRFGKLAVACKINDHRNVWGNDQYLIAPTEGRGEQWVMAERILVERDPTVC